MQQSGSHIPTLQTLAAQWRMLGLMLVAYARKVSGLQHAAAGTAKLEAERLELWTRCMLAVLNRQVLALQASGRELSEDERQALAHMKAMSLALLALAILARHYVTCGPNGVRAPAWQVRALRDASAWISRALTAGHPRPVPFLDSG